MKISMPTFQVNDSTKCYEDYTKTREQNTKTDAKLKSSIKDHYDHLKISNTKTSLVKFFHTLTEQKKESLAVIGSKHEIYKDLLAKLKDNNDINVVKPGVFEIADKEFHIQNFNLAPRPMHKMHMMARAAESDMIEIGGFSDDQFEAIKVGDDLYTKFIQSLIAEVFTPYNNRDSIINNDFYSANNVVDNSFREANNLADKNLSVCLGLNNEFSFEDFS